MPSSFNNINILILKDKACELTGVHKAL